MSILQLVGACREATELRNKRRLQFYTAGKIRFKPPERSPIWNCHQYRKCRPELVKTDPTNPPWQAYSLRTVVSNELMHCVSSRRKSVTSSNSSRSLPARMRPVRIRPCLFMGAELTNVPSCNIFWCMLSGWILNANRGTDKEDCSPCRWCEDQDQVQD